ncbi:MAG: S8 family serine peptidase [Rhodothermia bacterium]|nr:S8 family serine peptidase [Rhodothermia bacterium]
MKTPRLLSLSTLSFILVAVAFTGCTDSSFTETTTNSADHESVSPYAKLRHDHLLKAKFLSRHKVLERYEELAASNDFVLGMNKILERYKVLERYDSYPGVTIKKSYERSIDGFAVKVDGVLMTIEQFLALVEADPDIEWIEPDMKFPGNRTSGVLAENSSSQQMPSNIDHIDADLSWTLAGDGTGAVTGVQVYVMDTGISHSDLNVVEVVNFADDELAEGPVWEHGTHIAGTIAAIDDGDGVVGVAPGASIHSLRVLNNSGEAEMSAAIAAVEYVTLQKEANPSTPMVVNISFGADVGTWEYNALDQAIAESIAQGVTYVIAAGNDGIDATTVTPAHVYEAITVAAYEHDRSTFASFSNYGTAIDILAPGHNITSIAYGSTGNLKMSGTSMAAPHITGAAALYLAKYPSATPAQVVGAIYMASKNELRRAPAGTTKWRIALDLEPFGWDYFNNAGGNDGGTTDDGGKGGKGGGKNK